MISERGAFVLVVLGFPHLVLADVGDDDGVAVARLAPEIVDDVRGVEVAVVGQVLNVADRGVALQLVDEVEPLAAVDWTSAWGSNSSRTSRRSPTRATSTFTFLLISAGSIST